MPHERILTEEMIRLVERPRLGYEAAVRPDKTPAVSPRGTLAVLDGGRRAFADLRSPGTVANLKKSSASR